MSVYLQDLDSDIMRSKSGIRGVKVPKNDD